MSFESMQMLFFPINAAANGPSSSQDLNTMTNALSHDLVAVSTVLNNSLVPLLATIPDGTVDENVNGFVNGLDAKTLYADSSATSSYNSTYFLATKSRPLTIYECLQTLTGTLADLQRDLQNQITNLTASANSVSITDTGNYYRVNGNYDVEAALAQIGAWMAAH
jgi:hypothetical protein